VLAREADLYDSPKRVLGLAVEWQRRGVAPKRAAANVGWNPVRQGRVDLGECLDARSIA